MAHLEGFEPPTLGSEDRCSNPLSYRRLQFVAYAICDWLSKWLQRQWKDWRVEIKEVLL